MRIMNRKSFFVPLAALALVACGAPAGDESKKMNGNVLLAEWTGPYGGVPAFDEMKLEDLKPAWFGGEMKSGRVHIHILVDT